MALKGAIPGSLSRSVRRILVHEGKLLSCGVHGTVTMWDPVTLTDITSIESSQGAIWDMVVKDDKLYIATETGCVVVIEIKAETFTIQSFWRSSSKTATSVRALSLCIESGSLFVGDAAGSIARWNLSSGSCDSTLSIPTKNNQSPLIWSMLALGNGRFATGDSMGTCSIWDASNCTLVQARQDHQADILCMAFSEDKSELYTSGVDARINRYSLSTDDGMKFIHAATILPRDVSAMVITGSNLLVGGADARVAIADLNQTDMSSTKKLDRYYESDSRIFASGSSLVFAQETPSQVGIFTSEGKMIGVVDNGADSITSFTSFSDEDQGINRLFISGISGKCRILNIEKSISEFASIDNQPDGGVVSCCIMNERFVVIGTSTGKVFVSDISLKKISFEEIASIEGAVKKLFLHENSIVSVSNRGKIVRISDLGKKKKSVEVIAQASAAIVTAVSDNLDDGHLVLTNSNHEIFCYSVSTVDSAPVWRMKISKKFKQLSKYHHIKAIHLLPSSLGSVIMTMVSESVIFTQEFSNSVGKGLTPGKWMKQHSVVPLGGIAVGSGIARIQTVSSTSLAKKARKSTDLPESAVLVALNSYKAIHSKLVDEFERKCFTH